MEGFSPTLPLAGVIHTVQVTQAPTQPYCQEDGCGGTSQVQAAWDSSLLLMEISHRTIVWSAQIHEIFPLLLPYITLSGIIC